MLMQAAISGLLVESLSREMVLLGSTHSNNTRISCLDKKLAWLLINTGTSRQAVDTYSSVFR
jgi:hypothetical protein